MTLSWLVNERAVSLPVAWFDSQLGGMWPTLFFLANSQASSLALDGPIPWYLSSKSHVLCQDSFHLLGKYHISCWTVLVAVDWSLLFWNRQISLKRRSTYIVAGSCFPHRHFSPCDCRLPASVPLSLVLLYLRPIVGIISVSTIYIIKKVMNQ